MVFFSVVLIACYFSINSEINMTNMNRNELIQTEYTFARMADEKGVNAAFLHFLSADAVLFRPGPVNGHSWLLSQERDEGKLSWYPSRAEVSAAGDMGWATGPWIYSNQKTEIFGHYVSVWEKQNNGEWLVVIDGGIRHKQPAQKIDSLTINSKTDTYTREFPGDKERQNLVDLKEYDRAFSDIAQKEGLYAAALKYGSKHLRLYRQNKFPLVLADSINTYLKKQSSDQTCEPLFSRVSISGDLGYTYGLIKAGQVKKEVYLHIWKKEDNWRLILSLTNPLSLTEK